MLQKKKMQNTFIKEFDCVGVQKPSSYLLPLPTDTLKHAKVLSDDQLNYTAVCQKNKIPGKYKSHHALRHNATRNNYHNLEKGKDRIMNEETAEFINKKTGQAKLGKADSAIIQFKV